MQENLPNGFQVNESSRKHCRSEELNEESNEYDLLNLQPSKRQKKQHKSSRLKERRDEDDFSKQQPSKRYE